jgi:hypothetical protein
MSRVETSRRHAGECLAFDKSAAGERERQILIELAEALRRLIDEHDGEEPEIAWSDQLYEEKPPH